MPKFSFNALDQTGRLVQGVLDATSENDLIVRLSGQGLRVQSFTAGAQIASQPVRQPVPVQQRRIEAAHAQQLSAVKTHVAVTPILTKRAKYSELHFLFAQLGTLLRSGINPASALNELAQRNQKSHLRSALQHMATLTTEGRTLADAMAVYPNVFPPGAVGAIRAGESGGYTWQASEALSEQNHQAHKMAVAVRLFRWVAIPGLFAIPITIMMSRALDRSFKDLSSLPGYIRGLGIELVGPLGIVLIVMALTYWCISTGMKAPKFRSLRHRLGTKIPIFAKRARAESLASFNWHLSKLSEAGIAPSTAWGLAADALPNEEFASRMSAINQKVMDKSRLGDLVQRSGMYSPEHVSLIQTGEIAGSLPAALDQASRLASEELKTSDKLSKGSLYGAYLVMFMFIAIACGSIFFRGYFDSAYKYTVGETEQE